MPSTRLRSVLLLVLLAPQAACGAGWRQVDLAAAGMLSPGQQVQVWHAREVLRLHGVTTSEDSVSGVPYLQPTDCDSCRVSLARESIDSVRTGNPTSGFWKSVGLTLGGLLLAGVVICGASRDCQFGD
jgi:hypothetical protein